MVGVGEVRGGGKISNVLILYDDFMAEFCFHFYVFKYKK